MVQFEFVRGQVVEARVQPDGVEASAPRLDDDLGFAAGANRPPLNHSSRNLLLKDSLVPFSHGLP